MGLSIESGALPHIVTRRRLLGGFAGAVGLLMAACGGAPASPTAAPKAAEPTKPAAAAPTTAPAPAATTAPTAVAKPAEPTKPAAAATTAPAAKPGSTISWADAAKPYQGKTISILTSAGPWGKGHAAVVDEFVKLTGIKVNMENAPEGDAFNAKRQSVLLSRSGTVDLVSITFTEIAQYTKGGVCHEIGPWLTDPKFPAFDMSDYSENVINIFMRRDGKFYGIPAADGVQVMFYRKDLMQEAGIAKPPATWQEMADASRKLKKGDVWGAAFPFAQTGAFWNITNMLPKGEPTVDKDYRMSLFRDARSIENVQVLPPLVKDGAAPKDTLATGLVDTYNLFQSGKTAMLPMAWIVGVAQMEDPQASKVGGKNGYAILPGGGPNLGGWSYVIPVDAKEKEAAYLFASWLASKEVSAKQVLQFGNFDSVFHSSIFTDQFKQDMLKRPNGAAEIEALQAASQSHATARPSPLNIPEWGKVATAMAPSIQRIIAGELSAKDGMNQAADAGDAVLKEAGYPK
jgi:ABC-type glycerol-3-phosphate transport system substrate-binding protein